MAHAAAAAPHDLDAEPAVADAAAAAVADKLVQTLRELHSIAYELLSRQQLAQARCSIQTLLEALDAQLLRTRTSEDGTAEDEDGGGETGWPGPGPGQAPLVAPKVTARLTLLGRTVRLELHAGEEGDSPVGPVTRLQAAAAAQAPEGAAAGGNAVRASVMVHDDGTVRLVRLALAPSRTEARAAAKGP